MERKPGHLFCTRLPSMTTTTSAEPAHVTPYACITKLRFLLPTNQSPGSRTPDASAISLDLSFTWPHFFFSFFPLLSLAIWVSIYHCLTKDHRPVPPLEYHPTEGCASTRQIASVTPDNGFFRVRFGVMYDRITQVVAAYHVVVS
jgi:hypothetical protein